MFVAFIYILFAAAMAGFAYWDRINRDNYDIDHCVGIFFPVTAPFSLLFCYLRKLKEKRNDK